MPSEWTWETDETYRPVYTATATSDGITYMVMLGGPAGGPGMAGYQSYEQLLADGPLNSMPEAIAREVREHATRIVGTTERARLRWVLEVASPGMPPTEGLAYVSATINDLSVVIRVLEDDPAVLFEGSLPSGPLRLALTVGFGRPWRQPGARTSNHEVDVTLAAGATTTVTSTVRRDFTIVSR